jgi:hypothetical protein
MYKKDLTPIYKNKATINPQLIMYILVFLNKTTNKAFKDIFENHKIINFLIKTKKVLKIPY